MQSYPYYNVNKVKGGMMVKLFKNRQFKTLEDAVAAFNKWEDTHTRDFNSQYVILHYTSYYTSRICVIFENDTITCLN